MGFSLINHPYPSILGTPISGNPHLEDCAFSPCNSCLHRCFEHLQAGSVELVRTLPAKVVTLICFHHEKSGVNQHHIAPKVQPPELLTWDPQNWANLMDWLEHQGAPLAFLRLVARILALLFAGTEPKEFARALVFFNTPSTFSLDG